MASGVPRFVVAVGVAVEAARLLVISGVTTVFVGVLLELAALLENLDFEIVESLEAATVLAFRDGFLRGIMAMLSFSVTFRPG